MGLLGKSFDERMTSIVQNSRVTGYSMAVTDVANWCTKHTISTGTTSIDSREFLSWLREQQENRDERVRLEP